MPTLDLFNQRAAMNAAEIQVRKDGLEALSSGWSNSTGLARPGMLSIAFTFDFVGD